MTEDWRCAGHAGDLSDDAPLEYKLEGTEIGIYKVGDALYALENVCPHAYALLTQGFVDGDTATNLNTQPTLSTTATASSHVGTYAITASAAADPDYTMSYTGGILSVTGNAAALQVSRLRAFGLDWLKAWPRPDRLGLVRK